MTQEPPCLDGLPPSIRAQLAAALARREAEREAARRREEAQLGDRYRNLVAAVRDDLGPDLAPHVKLDRDAIRPALLVTRTGQELMLRVDLPGLSPLWVAYEQNSSGRWSRIKFAGQGGGLWRVGALVYDSLDDALVAAYDAAAEGVPF